MSDRFACRVTGQQRSTPRREPTSTTPGDPDAALRAWLRDWRRLSAAGFRNVYADARSEVWNVNHKEIQRLWREEGRRAPQRRRRKRTPAPERRLLPDGAWTRIREGRVGRIL